MFWVNVSTFEYLVRCLRETNCSLNIHVWPRDVRTGLFLLSHLRICHLTATKTTVDTVGSHVRPVRPRTVKSWLHRAGIWASHLYVGPSLTQMYRMRCIVWLTAQASQYFRWGSGYGSFLLMSPASFIIPQIVSVAFADIIRECFAGSCIVGRNLFVLRFYGPVNPMGSCRARSVYLTTRLLGRLSPLSG